MYSITNQIPLKELLLQQLPVLAVAFVIAELFYKFHSFTLECLAFLATWYILDLLVQFTKQRFKARPAMTDQENPASR